MNAILAIPFELRLIVLFVLGAWVGAGVNWCVASMRLDGRDRKDLPLGGNRPTRSAWASYLPIVRWLTMRRTSSSARSGVFRTILVELVAGGLFAWLYWWETARLGLMPLAAGQPEAQSLAHAKCAAHLLLLSLMLAASLIDLYERVIPDAITIFGTWLGLLLAAAWPATLLPEVELQPPAPPGVHFLRLTSPNDWTPGLNDWSLGLIIGLGCWWLWCGALLPRTWYGRHGWRRAMGLCCARLRREPITLRILMMGLCGSAVIVAVWALGGRHWEGLLTALVGVAASGGLVWVVRVLAYIVLRREAMGFGDVTLMAMIGAFLGWQAGLMTFFLAPFAGLIVGLLQVALWRENEIPYGPFLCLAALSVLVCWDWLWQRSEGVFAMGWLVPLVVAACMLVMPPILLLSRAIRETISPAR